MDGDGEVQGSAYAGSVFLSVISHLDFASAHTHPSLDTTDSERTSRTQWNGGDGDERPTV